MFNFYKYSINRRISADDSEVLNAQKCSISRSRCTKKHLAARLCPDPLGELIALPKLLVGFKGRDPRVTRVRKEKI